MELAEAIILNRELALGRLDFDEELYLEILAMFIEEAPKQFQTIANAVAAEDWQQVELNAHSFKSAAASVGAECLQACAQALELKARESVSFESIRLDIKALGEALKEFQIFMAKQE